jgi:hypothetical protein
MKVDLRNDPNQKDLVNYSEGLKMAKEINNCVGYYEISSKESIGMDFDNVGISASCHHSLKKNNCNLQ